MEITTVKYGRGEAEPEGLVKFSHDSEKNEGYFRQPDSVLEEAIREKLGKEAEHVTFRFSSNGDVKIVKPDGKASPAFAADDFAGMKAFLK